MASSVFALRGLHRKLKHLPRQALPITIEILDKFHQFLDMNNPVILLFGAYFCWPFFLMSRKSNLVPVSDKKFDGSKQLCRRDIDFNNSFIIVSFEWTKTIRVGNRVLRLPLAAISNSKFCPGQAYKRMCELNPFSADSPAFAALHKKAVIPIAYRQVQLKFKFLIGQVGLNPKWFPSHSFRRGGASLAARSGVAPHLIQLMRDWKSEAYKQYVVHSLTEKYKVARQMRNFVIKQF
jgi:hypothetical protein